MTCLSETSDLCVYTMICISFGLVYIGVYTTFCLCTNPLQLYIKYILRFNFHHLEIWDFIVGIINLMNTCSVLANYIYMFGGCDVYIFIFVDCWVIGTIRQFMFKHFK
jgi:hypothetical protein